MCDVLPLVINNMDMRLPASLMQKYMLKAAEFYIGYVTRGPSPDVQIQGRAVDVLLSSMDTLNLKICCPSLGSVSSFFLFTACMTFFLFLMLFV